MRSLDLDTSISHGIPSKKVFPLVGAIFRNLCHVLCSIVSSYMQCYIEESIVLLRPCSGGRERAGCGGRPVGQPLPPGQLRRLLVGGRRVSRGGTLLPRHPDCHPRPLPPPTKSLGPRRSAQRLQRRPGRLAGQFTQFSSHPPWFDSTPLLCARRLKTGWVKTSTFEWN